MTYAEKTEVSSERSRAEIERILSRWKATRFMYGWDGDQAVVGFEVRNRQVRFVVPMPAEDEDQFKRTNHDPPRPRTLSQRREAYEQAVRSRWRALALVIKAKLEAVESGIVSFDAEFLAQLVLPDGRTVGEDVVPKVVDAYANHTMPALLPSFSQQAIEA